MTPGTPETVLLDRRARITSAALRAAYAWSVRDRDQRAFAEVGRMTGVIMFELGPGVGPVAPLALVRCLRQPLGALLPALPPDTDGPYDVSVDDVVLLDEDDMLSVAAQQVGSDYVREVITGLDPGRDWLPAWSWMRANDVESELFARLIASGDEDAYRLNRKFLIEHPAGPEQVLAQACNEQGAARITRYVPIPDGQSFRSGERRWWWPCRICGWPMDVHGRSVRCRYPHHSAAYQVAGLVKDCPRLMQVQGQNLVGVGRALPDRQDCEGAVQVEEPVWRFVVVPGATELRLARRVTAAGASVLLYPNSDRYDLEVSVGDRRWDIDVKEHMTVEGLVRHVREKAPVARYIVLPETHAGQLHGVRESLSSYRVLTEGQLVGQIKRAAGQRKGSAS